MTSNQAIGQLSSALTQYDFPISYLSEILHYLDLHQDTSELSAKQKELLQQTLDSLSEQVPVEYIVGRALFCERYFKVTPDVLIPRFDTEKLVQKSVELIANEQKPWTIIDIGTGSGAIVISLALELSKVNGLVFIATDISQAALDIAKENAQSYKVDDHIAFQLSDVFPKDSEGNPFIPQTDHVLIVSNPPYISDKHMLALPKSVKDYEPDIALREQVGLLQKIEFYIDFLHEQKKNISLYLEYNNDQGKMVHYFLEYAQVNSVLNSLKRNSS